MHVTAQKHRVAYGALLQCIRHAGAGGAVAVPSVIEKGLPCASFVVALAKQGGLAHHVPGVAARVSAVKLGMQPRLLLQAQEGPLGVIPNNALGGVHRTGTQATVFGAHLRVFVLAAVEQIHRCQIAKIHALVNAQLGATVMRRGPPWHPY